MNAVKINRAELLAIVKTNRDSHIKSFGEAIEDYKTAILAIAVESLKLAKTGDLNKIATIRIMPSRPVSYEASYSRAIRMLELSVDEVIELNSDVFNQLVLDEWNWKAGFVASI